MNNRRINEREEKSRVWDQQGSFDKFRHYKIKIIFNSIIMSTPINSQSVCAGLVRKICRAWTRITHPCMFLTARIVYFKKKMQSSAHACSYFAHGWLLFLGPGDQVCWIEHQCPRNSSFEPSGFDSPSRKGFSSDCSQCDSHESAICACASVWK